MKSTGGYRVSYPWPIRFSKWRVCDELPWAGATYCVRVTWITAMTRAQCWPQKRVCELTAETRRLRLRSSRGSGKFSPDTGDRWHVALIRALHGKKIEGTYVCVCVCVPWKRYLGDVGRENWDGSFGILRSITS